MKTIRYSTQFKKDIKKYANNQQKIDALFEIVKYLERSVPIPAIYKPHRLKGEYKGCWECHIENDYLLIWMDETNHVVCLERLGSHQLLFVK